MSSPAETAVVCDTTAYLPKDLLASKGIRTISLYVAVDGEQEKESEITDFDEFYERLRASESGATTSQPSVGDFLEVYEPLIEDGADIVSLHLSGGISGTVRSAEQARDALIERGVAPERMIVLDSRMGCAGHGLMAIAAANAAAGGANLQGAADAANALRETSRILFAVDTLEFLRRGGRIGAAQALLGSALKIKPILSIDSEIFPVERVRTSARAADRLIRELQERRDEGADVFFIQHVQAPDVAARIAERGAEVYGRPPEFISEIGPVIGTHTGPGLIGVMGLRSSLLGPV